MKVISIVGLIFAGLLCSLLIFAAESLVIAVIAQETWNMFAGYFKLGEIGYWQMFGIIMFLCIIKSVLCMKIESRND